MDVATDPLKTQMTTATDGGLFSPSDRPDFPATIEALQRSLLPASQKDIKTASVSAAAFGVHFRY